MADNSAIEWTDATWNPIRARNRKTGKTGWHCEHATTGCEFCYAEGFNKRLGTGLPFKPGHLKDIELFLDQDMLTQPLRWKKPRMIFVCSMTDLFADFVPDEFIDKMFAVMALAPQHTFQVLTKRVRRMRQWFDRRSGQYSNGAQLSVYHMLAGAGSMERPRGFGRKSEDVAACMARMIEPKGWPLQNVWLGVSAERQAEAEERIPLLLKTPAAVRFVSAEPLLGQINLDDLVTIGAGYEDHRSALECDVDIEDDEEFKGAVIDWVIAGGESGPKARPMHPDWARSLRDQCAAAGVAYFFKQWGEWAPHEPPTEADLERLQNAGKIYGESIRVGKKAAGRLLDGELHNATPERRA